ncbi:MAG: glycoside hydrolase family 9, partial [Verrucomicrobiales bacterium]|nr:glycoside hydrolase family 9 [Verrucomicrobiales bacterium]
MVSPDTEGRLTELKHMYLGNHVEKRRLLECKSVLQLLAVILLVTSGGAPSKANSLALPSIGDHSLKVLSPVILELSLVTTKSPDPASTVQWSFVESNFSLRLPSLSSFVVEVDSTPVAIARVGFKRRPLYAPLKTRDLRIGNYLYLVLQVPLSDGQKVTVTNPAGDLWPAATTQYSAVVDSFSYNPALHVNQVGYLPDQSKKGMIGYYLGSLGEMEIPGSSFNIVNVQTRQVVFTGSTTNRRDVGFEYTPAPYQKVYEADFTAFQTPGEYVLQVPGMGVSLPFLINDGTAAAFARAFALGLYHQRCGTDNALPFTRFGHGACHMALAEVPDMSFASVNSQLANESSDYADNPYHSAPQLKNVDSSLYPFINKEPVDVSGGHHDAGDYSKYTIDSASLIHHLVFAADSFPGVGALDNLNLPESGDGKSDLLQEAKWEADFLVKMQDADGGFYFLVYPRNRTYEDNVLPDHGDPQVVFPKTTAATAAAVGALAEIASSPAFKQQFPTEAASYLLHATEGWVFLTNAIARFGKNGSYQKITHYGNEFMHDDELAWAAAAMFVGTGNPAFHKYLKSFYDPSDPNTLRWTWWRLFEGYGCAARAYAFAARSGRLPASALDPDDREKCVAPILASGDDIARFARQTAYNTSFPDPDKAFGNASWYFSSERAFEMATAFQLIAKPAYLEAILGNMN